MSGNIKKPCESVRAVGCVQVVVGLLGPSWVFQSCRACARAVVGVSVFAELEPSRVSLLYYSQAP